MTGSNRQPGAQPVPDVSRADIARVVGRDYAAELAEVVHAELNRYNANGTDRTAARVQLAALKLAAGDIERLQSAINDANRDFRDVIAAAEYPEYCRLVRPSSGLSADEKQQIIDADWQQYRDWLEA
jgi:hypothetical protein